jgi:hypothetical protein
MQDGPRFDITAITRQTSSYTAPLDSNITHKTVDYSSFDCLVTAFTGQDAIVNCVTGGATQYEPSKLIIDAAIAAGVEFFFANEFVSNMESEQFKRLPEARAGAKVRIRAYLEGLGKEGKISWTSLNGGPFFDMCEYPHNYLIQKSLQLVRGDDSDTYAGLAKGPGGFDLANRRARIYGIGDDAGNNPLFWTPLPTIALAAANMLRNPEPVRNRPIYICSIPHLTQNVILAALEGIFKTKFAVEYVDVKKINENARIALERGEEIKAMKGLAVSNQFYAGDCGNDFSHLVENETVGVEMTSVEDAIRDTIKRYGEDCKVVESMFIVEPCEV